MIREHAEVAILGAGFAGSLTALALSRLGLHPVLLERGAHPRFAIGESSTPLGNLLLEDLARRYDLPRLFPLTKYGRWRQAYPQLPCGLKRGFSYFQHYPGQPFVPSVDHRDELLVAASPTVEAADTHWFREEFDHFLVREVQSAGIPYLDRTEIAAIERGNQGWQLRGRRGETDVTVHASFLIDATGPAGLLARMLGIPTAPAGIHTNSWAIYSHFTGVERWEDILEEMHAATGDYPFPADDAALHHVLPDGWMWVLRFNHGVTSAGVAFHGGRRPRNPQLAPEALWRSIMAEHPTLARQFTRAERVQPWIVTNRLQRRAALAAGPDWAFLPHAAYFLDPLFSPGIAHTLVGIERVVRIFEQRPERRGDGLRDYESALFAEMEFVDWLVHGCYELFGRFDLFCAYAMYYFAGAVQSETLRRKHDDGARGFLFSLHPEFRAAVRNCHDHLASLGSASELADRVQRDIAHFNPAGFCDPARRNMYPFVAL